MMRLSALVLCTLFATTAEWPAHAAAPAEEVAERRLDHISIETIGTGDPVVLIPGLASPREVWASIAPELAQDHRVILVEVNGFAGSDAGANARPGLLAGAVDDLARWLADNKIQKPAIIGHSMGGLMAMMLAKEHPSAAGKLMIVDALPFYGMLFGPTATPDAIRPLVEQMRDKMVADTAPPQAPPHMSNTEGGRAKILEWLSASDRKTVGQALVEDATTDFRPALPAIDGKSVTVLYAVPSPERAALTANLYREAYKTLPGAKLIAVEDSEHFIMLDQPERFAEEVDAFLR